MMKPTHALYGFRKEATAPERRLTILLSRLEQTVPFPGDLLQFYESLYPRELIDLVRTPGSGEMGRNLQCAVSLGTYATVALGGDEFFRVFLPATPAFPVPPNRPDDAPSGWVLCPYNHPHRSAIRTWHEAAANCEDELSAAIDIAQRVLTDATALTAWPELANALGVKMTKRPPAKAMKRLRALADDSSRESISTMLASATLLPPLTAPHAWIGLIGRT